MDVGEDHGAQPALPLRPYLRHGQQDQRHEPTAQQLPDDERFLAWQVSSCAGSESTVEITLSFCLPVCLSVRIIFVFSQGYFLNL